MQLVGYIVPDDDNHDDADVTEQQPTILCTLPIIHYSLIYCVCTKSNLLLLCSTVCALNRELYSTVQCTQYCTNTVVIKSTAHTANSPQPTANSNSPQPKAKQCLSRSPSTQWVLSPIAHESASTTSALCVCLPPFPRRCPVQRANWLVKLR